jgi:O-acetyl-ADP-ribose deacetylase (regulator of RNase III)
MLQYIVKGLVLTLGIAACECNCRKNPITPTDLSDASSSDTEQFPLNDKLQTLKWNNPGKGDLSVGTAMIDGAGSDSWINQLKIDKTKKETVFVNASNENITSPGGGLDGALAGWATNNSITPWKNPQALLPGGAAAPNSLSAGQFAIVAGNFGYIYLAVGPRATNVNTLAKTSKLLETLYANILDQAQKDGMKKVVLPAVSTAIFAGKGTESETGKPFTKDEFLYHVYLGMHDGIEKFRTSHPGHTLKIILNNWDARLMNGLKKV